jgi:phage shock protein A
MISLAGLVSQKAFGKFEMGKVISNPFATAFVNEAEGQDHEVSMANNSLDTIIKMATELKSKMGDTEKDIPAWIQDHITNAENYISQASSNYHEYKANESRISEDSPCWKGYKQVGMKDKGGKQVPNCVPNESIVKEAGLYGGVPKMYVKYMAVQKKVKELEDKQKALAAKYFAEKELNKKEKMLVDLKKGTATLAGYRKNLADIEEKYINNLYKDAEYTGEE